MDRDHKFVFPSKFTDLQAETSDERYKVESVDLVKSMDEKRIKRHIQQF